VRRSLLFIALVPLVVTATAAAKELRGTKANDTLVGTAAADVIYGYAGDDNIYGGAGNDHLYGGSGKDHIFAGAGNDTVIGGPPVDRTEATGISRHERIYGGGGNDVLIMRVAGGILAGGAGDDRLDARDPTSDCRRPAQRRLARALDPPHCSNLVSGGPGHDVIRTDDGSYDIVNSCRDGGDVVTADQYDAVAADCKVRRIKR
jgi:Ca2+-binding RTX toxin-like protein